MGKSVCIIGAGISGLCTAYRLKKRGFNVTLLEKSERVGGNIRSERHDGFLIEHGPNSLLASAPLIGLIEELGLMDEVATADPAAKRRFVLRDGRLTALPTKLTDAVFRPPLSVKGILRVLWEPFIKGRSGDSESVADFFGRRFGREVVDYLLDPFISGVFAGDSDRLSIQSAFPVLHDLERDYGSVIKGFLKRPKDSSAKLPKHITRTLSFKNGLQTLTEKLREELGTSISLGIETQFVRKTPVGRIEVGSGEATRVFDAIIISTPAYIAAWLLKGMDSGFADDLCSIEYPPVSVIHSGYRKSDVGVAPSGFGFLVPGIENRKILGSLWTSTVFAGRAPSDYYLMTTFIGGARNPDLASATDDDLIELAHAELAEIMEIKERPVFSEVKKWPRAIPQYNIGYENVVAAIENFRQQHPSIFFCSNFYGGISVGDCIKNSAKTAEEVITLFGNA